MARPVNARLARRHIACLGTGTAVPRRWHSLIKSRLMRIVRMKRDLIPSMVD